MRKKSRHKFYFSALHREWLIHCAAGDFINHPNGYVPLLAKLDSGETIEFTQACDETLELNQDFLSNFPDYAFLGTGEMAGYGKPVQRSRWRYQAIPRAEKPASKRRTTLSKQAEFEAVCERCKRNRTDCMVVPYNIPPHLSPPASIDPVQEDVSIPSAIMCDECRRLKEKFSSFSKD